MANDEAGSVTSSVKDKVGTVEFAHPKGNSLPGPLLDQLAKTIHELGRRTDVAVLLLRSAGDGAFCGGASFDELRKLDTPIDGKQFFLGFAKVIIAIKECPKFVVARVHGKAVGGGVGIIAAADYALASGAASIKLSELALGLGPFVIGPAVQRKIGLSNFSAIALDTEWRDAEWAATAGLFARVCENTPALDHAVGDLVARLADTSQDAMEKLKAALWRGTEHWSTLLETRAEVSGRLALGEATRKAITASK